jgi:SOS-response transcriptional repressor LexA
VLSEKQRRLMHFLTSFIEARDRGPSYTQIMEALPHYGSRSNVHYDLHALERAGHIRITGRKGGIEVLKKLPKVGIYRRACPCCLRDWPH